MNFTVYPAIDVREGRVVRLKQGDYAQETRYSDSPLALAQAYAESGSAWLHLVDLDAARDGGYAVEALLTAIKSSTVLNIQTGGGVRSESDLLRLLNAGADRVVIGSLAVREPERVAEWLRRFGADRITVALDSRQDDSGAWLLPVKGWTESSELLLINLTLDYADAGLKHLLCTDIGRDGMLSGPNFDLYAQLRSIAPQLAIQASGGARDLADVQAARQAGCAGIILGKALLEGRLALEDALREQVSPC
jgi:phosphoribosylformimino-5-aminoimidazole carboxamide ribotide isomerase